METIKGIIHLFGGKLEILNILLLFVLFLLLASSIKNVLVRILTACFLSFVLTLELFSLYSIKSFINYQFYIHSNLNDIIGMMDMYIVQIFIASILFILLLLSLFFSKKLFQKFIQITSRLHPMVKQIYHPIVIGISISLFVILSITLMSLHRGILNTSYKFYKVLSTVNSGQKSFEKLIVKAGMQDYITPENLKVTSGKNIIVISLESLEKGYLDTKMAHLTPNLRSLKKKWRYVDIEQNSGSGWTSASLYTSFTGFPAFFGMEGNSIFQTAYHSSITGLGHILQEADYTTTYLTSDAKFAGTEDMLHTFQINNVIDKTVLGEYSKDKDLFEKAKLEVQSNLNQKKPFALFISTLDTHFPDGIYDKRMEEYVKPQDSELKFMVSAVDYMIGDFMDYLEQQGALSNTVIYIFPDHLKMGNPTIFEGTGKRGLYLLTNANIILKNKNTQPLYQIDLVKMILTGANIKHNAKFLTDYISGDKNAFIKNNQVMLTALNTSGLLRKNVKPFVPVLSKNYDTYKNDINRYIAHAGGMINTHKYTNSLEALDLNYSKGFRLFELDIIKTQEGKYVAAHDWEHWASITNYEGELPVTSEEFLKHKIYDTYTPLDMDKINAWFSEHKDAILVTDKINEPKLFSEKFIDKDRLIMELFTLAAVKEGVKANIKSAMPSENVVNSLGEKKVATLKQLGVKNISISRRSIAKNIDLLQKLEQVDIKTYVFHINYDVGINEDYVVKYEMDNIYGIYADKWNFRTK